MNSNTDDENIQTLVSMGFSIEQCSRALAASGGDLNQSINILLCSSPSAQEETMTTTTTATNANSNGNRGSSTMIQIELSQYSFSEGTSAFSSISLAFAAAFLSDINIGQHSTSTSSKEISIQEIVTPDWLQAAMFTGIQNYWFEWLLCSIP